jgi:hypothetical protein
MKSDFFVYIQGTNQRRLDPLFTKITKLGGAVNKIGENCQYLMEA